MCKIFDNFEKTEKLQQDRKKTFSRKNAEWLNKDFVLLLEVLENAFENLPITSSVGQPQTSFKQSSKRSKRRGSTTAKEHETTALTYAAQMNLWAEGKVYDAKLIAEALHITLRRARRIREAWQKINFVVQHTPDEAFSLFIETKLTKSHYTIRMQAKQKKADIYPNYLKLRAAKQE